MRSGLTLTLQDVCLYTRRRITEVRRLTGLGFCCICWGQGCVCGEGGWVLLSLCLLGFGGDGLFRYTRRRITEVRVGIDCSQAAWG